MKLSQYIIQLHRIYGEKGDLDIAVYKNEDDLTEPILQVEPTENFMEENITELGIKGDEVVTIGFAI